MPKTNSHEAAKLEYEQESGAYFYLADPSKFAATAAARAALAEAVAASLCLNVRKMLLHQPQQSMC